MSDDSRRLKRFFLPYEFFVQLYNSAWSAPCICECRIGGELIPEDAEVVCINQDFSRIGMSAQVRHPSFDVVPVGAETPFSDEDFSLTIKNISSKDREEYLLNEIEKRDSLIADLNQEILDLKIKAIGD